MKDALFPEGDIRNLFSDPSHAGEVKVIKIEEEIQAAIDKESKKNLPFSNSEEERRSRQNSAWLMTQVVGHEQVFSKS